MGEHFGPSFERRLSHLLAVLIFVAAGQFGSWQSGLYMAVLVTLFGEVFELIFGKGYAFEILPVGQKRGKSVLDFVLHPVVLVGLSLSALISLTSPTLGFVYPLCVLVVALAVAAVYHLKEDESPEQIEDKKIEPYLTRKTV